MSVLDEKSSLGVKGSGKVAAGALGKGGAAGTPAGGAAAPWMAAPAGAATAMSAAGVPGLLNVLEGSGDSDEPDDNNDNGNYVKNLALTESRIRAQASADAASATSAATNGVIALAAFAAMGVRTAPSRACGCLPLQMRRSGQSPPAIRIIAASLVVVASAIAASSLTLAPAYADSNPAGAAYRSDTGANGLDSPKYREWDPVALAWSGEVELPSTGSSVRDVRLLINPQTLQRVVVSISSNGEMNLFRCDSGCTSAASWSRVSGSSFADVGPASSQYRYFDAAYEQASGQLLIVYDKSTKEAADIYYRTFDGIALSGEIGFNYARGAATDEELVPYIRMASKNNADEITLVLQEKPSEQDDDGGDGGTGRNSWAIVWNGSSFGNILQITDSMSNTSFEAEAIGVDYETASGASVVFSGEGNDTARYARWVPLSGWSAVGITDPDTSSNNNEVRFVSVKADQAAGSNRVMVCQVGDNRDLTCTQINAGALVSRWVEHDTSVDRANTRSFDFVWEPSGSLGLLVWGTSSGSVSRRTYSGDSDSWGATGTVQYAGTHPWIIGAANSAGYDTVRALFISINSQQDFGSMKWDGSSLALVDVASLTRDSGSTNFEGGSIAFFKKKAAGHSSRSVADSFAASDTVARAVTVSRTVQDSVLVHDEISVGMHFARSAADLLAAQDAAGKTLVATRSVQDGAAVADAATRSHLAERSAQNALGVQDGAIALRRFDRPAGDTLAITDGITRSIAHAAADSLAVIDSVHTTVAPGVFDSVSVFDLLDHTRLAVRAVADGIRVSDPTAAGTGTWTGDTVGVSDSITIAQPVGSRRASELLSITEVVSVRFSRSVSETLAVAESIKSARAVTMSDSIAVGVHVTDALVHWNRTFDESFALGDCTPFSCNQALRFDEGLGMRDAFLPPPAVGEVIAMGDSISRNIVLGKNLGETISAAERTDFMIKPGPPEPQPGSPLPPASVLVVSNKTAAGLPSSVPVSGVYNWTGNTASLREVMKPTPHVINATVSRPDLPMLTMVLPTYHIPITPSADLPGDDVLMTVMAAEVPAGMPVIVPINVASTPGIAEHSTFAEWMSIEFAPRVNTTNFSLVVTVVDAPPTVYSPPEGDLKPLYIDVRWIGEFPGAEDPSVSSYYEAPPRFTFAVVEEWVVRENITRDANGVPMVKLSLLNESTGAWEEIQSITPSVSAVGGIYTYVATLPHFSTYAVTADKASAPPVSGPAPVGNHGVSSSAPAVAVPQIEGLVVSLVESLGVGDLQRAVPVEVVEEFGQKRLAVGLADAIAVLVKPVSYKSFTVGQVNARIAMHDVRHESIVPPIAIATFVVDVENTGDDREEFVLNFWYYDETGGRAYESSQAVALGPMESERLTVPVPFTSAGTFEVTVEARSVPDGDLLNTLQLTVTVPWLAVNLYLLVAVAIAILGSSVGTVALLTRGAHGRLLLPDADRTAAPKIRVIPAADGGEGGEDGASAAGTCAPGHDVLVRVSLRNDPSGGGTVASGPAVFELELENRSSKRRIELVLECSAADASSGAVLYRKAEKVCINALSTERRTVEVALPPGSYDFVVEAAGQQGKKQGMQRGQGRFRVTML